MDEKSLEMLEFHRIREILAGFTSFSASHEMALNLQPLAEHEMVSLLLRQSAEARQLLATAPDFSCGTLVDVRSATKMAARGKVLEPQTLVEIQTTLASIRQLRSNLSQQSKDFPQLWSIASGLVEMRQLERDIASCLTPNGELLDSASPQLATVRQRLREARQHLLGRLDAMIRSPRGRRILQEPLITEREGRYVLPVKIEYRKEIKGIVHDVSNTGVTIFIEPWATIELGNELRELVMEERREIERILGDLSMKVGASETEISQSIALAAELDLTLAKARYARKARATEPALNAVAGDDGKTPAGTGVLRLVEARHPLLGDKAVPLTVEIGRNFSILVITGPNMGGKTVALKTIGLLSLMAQSGLPIPASAESCLPVFDGIFADIGDEQSIEQTLSTFSWHIGNIVRIIKSATRRSLVLLDELGTNTDPAEGAALARSILLHLLSRQTLAAATTHYSDLKAYAHTTPGLQNASFDFDPVTLVPTYRLTVGVPGGSNALATAAHLGLPAEIISAARGMLTKGSEEMESLLASLASQKQGLDARHARLEHERQAVERLNVELENRLKWLKAEEQRIVRETRDRVVREAAELQREIRQATAELRKAKTREGIERARQTLTMMREQLKGEAWQTDTVTKEKGATEERIAPGDTVLLKEANLSATVLSVSPATGQVEVQAGQAIVRVSLDSVEKVRAAPAGTALGVRPATTRKRDRRSVLPELDLRGKRADEVEPLLDSYLNDACLANLNEVRIIHGIATGTVRAIVREFLASHPLAKSFRPGETGEGGDGATIVRL